MRPEPPAGSMDSLADIKDAFERSVYRTPRLLLVEDDETDVIFIRRCLSRHGGDVPLTVARDGREALQLLREGGVERPYVILTDLNMPGMSGHEMIDEIRGDEDLKHSGIFVLSSSRLAGDIQRAYENNVAGYLTKQVPAEELSRNVGMVFDYCAAVHLPG